MHPIKSQNFRRDRPGEEFPDHRSLSAEACAAIRDHLATLLGLGPGGDPLVLVKQLDALSTELEHLNAEADTFDLGDVLKTQGIKPEDEVLVNWYRFTEIDAMALSDLVRYFADLWYPGPDDIDILDASLSWILAVGHDGQVKLLQLPSRDPGPVSK